MSKGKNIAIGAIQLNGHSLKLHFCMFGKSQGNHNIIWIFIKKFGIIFH
jgi:hypothetical protein